MSNCHKFWGLFLYSCWAATVISCLPEPGRSQGEPCRISNQEAVSKANLLQALVQEENSGVPYNSLARQQYDQLVAKHAKNLANCRQITKPATLGIWLRVYPCDLQPGSLDQTLDNIVNLGYNRIYLNTFYDGRVLLPQQDNPTIWKSVVGAEAPRADLLAEVIQKGRQRGIKVYAWLFTMNFGPKYGSKTEGTTRHEAIARNGFGETNLEDPAALPEVKQASHIFVDPYNQEARNDLRTLVQAVAQRKPDGMVFDYVRYAHRTRPMLTDVRDLMIYGTSSFKLLMQRSLTPQSANLLYNYLAKGQVTNKAKSLSNAWKSPLGITRSAQSTSLNQQLWQLVIAHAQNGVVEFLNQAIAPAKQQNIATGAVFFPRANQVSDLGVDPRLQPWHQFKEVGEWLPMIYGACGNTDCLVEELGLVMQQANERQQVICPVLAGYSGQSLNGRPALETQMSAIYRAYPKLQCMSHFAYSWIDPELDRRRRTCKLSNKSAVRKEWQNNYIKIY
jgi:hypothetical protein